MKKTLKNYDFNDKKVLVRVDFNVPIVNGVITNDDRIVKSLPTIKYLLENGATLILMSHLGRPKGKFNKDLTMKLVSKKLSELLNKEIEYLEDEKIISEKTKEKIKNAKKGSVILLENTRFVEEEEKNDDEFSKNLASIADIYVNDAFGTSHRGHASNVGVSKYLPSAIGFLIEKEIKYIKNTIDNPKRPFIAILGGAKVSDKIKVIDNLLDKTDEIIIVGAMAYTFLKAQGYEIGKSLVENDKIDLAIEILKKAKENNIKILLPVDVIVAKEISDDFPFENVSIDEIPKDMMGLDIGEKSIGNIKNDLLGAKTVIWNGPAGVFELKNFSKGTFEIAHILANLENATTIIGGGDSASAVEQSGESDKISHISTGGGASLEMLEGKELPGIKCIEEE